MFARYFSADQVQGYRASPHKPRIDHVAQALVDRRYLDVVVADHLREWLRFTTHVDALALPLPSSVHAPEVQAYIAHRLPHGSASRLRCVRASVRIFLETDPRGAFRRRIGTAIARPVQAWSASAVDAYTAFLHQHRGLADRTVRKRTWQLAQCADLLAQAGVMTWTQIRASQIQQLFTQLQGQQSATRLTYAATLRGFLRWAYQEGLVSTDLSAAVITARHVRQARVRDVLSAEEVDRLLAAVDRSGATGRRDYAVLMLAVRYGMRPSDIRHLRLDDVRWRQGLIMIEQAKTGRPLTSTMLCTT